MKKVLIKPGYGCNNDCIFCHEYDNRKFKELGTEETKKMIAEAREAGCEWVVLSGGEPTIREDIKEIVSEILEQGMQTELVTNARMLSKKELLNELKQRGLKSTIASIAGPNKEVHERITRRAGSFNETTEGIKNLIEAGINTRINFVVIAQNKDYLKEMVELAEKLKVKEIRLALAEPKGACLKDYDNQKVRLREAAEKVIEAVKLGERKGIIVRTDGFAACLLGDYYYTNNPLKEEKIALRFERNNAKHDERHKPDKCKKCKIYNECDGIYNVYIEKYGDNELEPF